MNRPTIYDTLERPGGGVPDTDTVWVVELAGESGEAIEGYVPELDLTIVKAPRRVKPNRAGYIKVQLIPSVKIEPAGSVWKITTVTGNRAGPPAAVEAPDDNLEHYIGLCLSEFPGALPSGPLRAEIARAEEAEALLIPLAEKAAPNGVATLGPTGEIPAGQLPPLVISAFLGEPASQAAMLALTGERGDWCIRTDLAAAFVLVADGGSDLADWKRLPQPLVPVASVNERVGAVVGLAEQVDLDDVADDVASFMAKVGRWMGTWDPATEYLIGDAVEWNGSGYITNAAGVTPEPPAPDPDVVTVVGPPGAKGDKGDKGDTGLIGLTGLQGNTGAAGAVGGAISIPYVFSTTTTNSDPGAGNLRLSNATQNIGVFVRVNPVGAFGTNWATIIATLADSTNTIKGHLRLVHSTDPTKWLLWTVAAVVDSGGFYNITVTNIGYSSANPFANGDPVTLLFTRAGDVGGTGATGATGTAGADGATGVGTGQSLARKTSVAATTIGVAETDILDDVGAAMSITFTADATRATRVVAKIPGVGAGTANSLVTVKLCDGANVQKDSGFQRSGTAARNHTTIILDDIVAAGSGVVTRKLRAICGTADGVVNSATASRITLEAIVQ